MKLSSVLAKWYHDNKRDLPWRDTTSPYHIWLSEIILQQTRVDQGLGYYRRFVAMYPEIQDLAAASADEVLKLWQGLGYYTRARNMHETAKVIVNEYNGIFPATYAGLLKLKGIGKYTAAAVASMAFNEPVAVVDGNVYRVISRIFGISDSIDSAKGKKVFELKAAELLNTAEPGTHNQALMEFGAMICLPRNPLCSECVLAGICQARISDTIRLLPVKKLKGKSKIRYFNYLFVELNGKTLLKKRNNKDIWHSLYEFPLIESTGPVTFSVLIAHPSWQAITGHISAVCEETKTYEHKLTHQTLVCSFTRVNIKSEPRNHEYILADMNDLNKFAVPRVIEKYLEDII